MTNLNCSDESLKRLKEAVLKKHGKLYGSLLVEVNIALNEQAKRINQEIKEEGEV